jgi:hypothetical protein
VAAEWSQVNFPTKNITINKIFVLAVALLVTFSQISYVFWMGFPPFLWTCCIILAIVKVITDEKIQSRRVMIGIFGLTLVNYSYPLLSPVLIFVLVFELIKMSKNDYLFVWTHKKIMSVLVLIATVLNVAVVMKSLNVRHYVDDEGGIQPIDVKNFFLLVSVVTMLVIFSRLTLRTMPLIVFTFYASLINFGALALISKRSVGYVSYYPVKAGYLVIILGIASLGGIIRFVPKIYGRGLIHFLTILLAVGVLCFYNTNASSSKLDFTSTQSAWKHLFHNSKDQNRECFLHAMDTTSDLNLNADNRTILFQQHDLNTRWINGIRGRLIDATYSLAIPVGQAKQSLPEILEWWTVQFPNVRILILAAEPPTGLEKWSDKIEYRHFACG